MQLITDLVTKALKDLDLPLVDFSVTHPKEESYGDYSVNVAMILAKRMGPPTGEVNKNPRDLAQKIVEAINKDPSFVEQFEKADVAGPGFINFYLKKEFFIGQLEKSLEEGYGHNETGAGKLAIVEYSSPNIAKPFTIGHLRSTVIGDAVANLLVANGWRVLRDNHLGDWGTQFGKQIAAIKRWGSITEIGQAENPVKELVALYVKFHEEAEKDPALNDEARLWFKKLEDGDKEARDLWQMCIDWSWKEFARIYELLGVHHSPEFNGGRGLGESFFENKMGVVLDILSKQDWYKEGKEGAKLVFFPNDKYSPAMILKKDGATLYHTRDLATDKYRLETYHPDLIINEVGAEQELYFQQLYEIEKMLGWYSEGQRVHVKHGMYRFAEGKMSTRKGNVIWLEEVLDEAIKRAGELGKNGAKVAREVGIGALKWNDLKGETRRDIVFDWEQVMNMQGDSGPYIQYTFARTQSLLRKAGITRVKPSQEVDRVVVMQGLNPCIEEMSILRWIYRYPEVVAEAGLKYAPHLVATYIYELAQRFNTFYNKHEILKTPSRLVLTEAVGKILESGLSLLGIQAPAEM